MPTARKRKIGVTLIELMVTIAIIGILAGVILYRNDRAKYARDAKRKIEIPQIANALEEYAATINNGIYPTVDSGYLCISSKGRSTLNSCNPSVPGSNWNTASEIYKVLVRNPTTNQEGTLDRLPIDPLNNNLYYYRYTPQTTGCGGSTRCRYWIGGRLEKPNDPSKPLYRCSDNIMLTNGVGCKEVDTLGT